MKKVFIISAKRTAIGALSTLKDISAVSWEQSYKKVLETKVSQKMLMKLSLGMF